MPSLLSLCVSLCLSLLLLFHTAIADTNVLQSTQLYDDFQSGRLDPEVWRIAKRQWGGCFDSQDVCAQPANGGVTPQNVFIEEGPTGKNFLRLEMHGNQYDGPIYGVYKNGTVRTDSAGKVRVGAAIVTQRYFGSGSYEVHAKLTRYPAGQDSGGGVVNGFWTFHYREYYPGDDSYIAMPVGTFLRPFENLTGYYYAKNHEIDIEIPGRTAGTISDGVSFKKALYTYWRGENGDATGLHPYVLWKGAFVVPDSQYTPCRTPCYQDYGWQGWDEFRTNFVTQSADLRLGGDVGPDGLDGWHTFRIDWHTGGSQSRRVDYYIDGVLSYSSEQDPIFSGPGGTSTISADSYVPLTGGRFWIGGWFPYGFNVLSKRASHWAGEPEFDVDNLLVDWVRITPYSEPGDDNAAETYPEAGYGSRYEYPLRVSGTFPLVWLTFLESWYNYNQAVYTKAIADTLSIDQSRVVILSVKGLSDSQLQLGVKLLTDYSLSSYSATVANKLVYVVNNQLVSVFASRGLSVVSAYQEVGTQNDWASVPAPTAASSAQRTSILNVAVPAVAAIVGCVIITVAVVLLVRSLRSGSQKVRPYNDKLPL